MMRGTHTSPINALARASLTSCAIVLLATICACESDQERRQKELDHQRAMAQIELEAERKRIQLEEDRQDRIRERARKEEELKRARERKEEERKRAALELERKRAREEEERQARIAAEEELRFMAQLEAEEEARERSEHYRKRKHVVDLEAGFRRSLLDSSTYVLHLRNIHTESVDFHLRCYETSGRYKTFFISVPALGSKEIGFLEGWVFVPNESCKAIYKDETLWTVTAR